MRLLFIRHGDPDYANDTLTEQGKIEAKLLSDVIGDFEIDDIYVSPLGRARDRQSIRLGCLEESLRNLSKLQVQMSQAVQL